jgi:surface polysaccharide O-acyltransferase-like enzyme
MQFIYVEKKHYSNIDYLKAIAILSVVLMHVLAIIIGTQKGGFFFLGLAIRLVSFAVPLFFFASGFLSLNASYNKIFSRLPRIIIPYFLVSIAAELFFPANYGKGIFVILLDLVFGRALNLFFFVFVLVYLYLSAPIFSKYQNKLKELFLFALALAFTFCLAQDLNLINPAQLPGDFVLRYPLFWVPFFLFGMLFKKHEAELDSFYNKKILFAVLIAFLVLTIIQYFYFPLREWTYRGVIWLGYSFAFTIFLFFWLKSKQKAKNFFYFTARKTYSIYLLHIIPLLYFSEHNQLAMQYYPLNLIALFFIALLFSVALVEISKLLFGKKSRLVVGS